VILYILIEGDLMLLEQYNAMQKNNYVGPLDKYFKTKTLQRLEGKGLFCGMDYVGYKPIRPREYYSRLSHSKNVGYTAWTLSENLTIALAGAFHDVGSLSFAHVNSFKKGQGLTQDKDEWSIKEILLQDEELLTYLHEDGININEVVDYSKYPLIDKEIPSLCLDRVDGILATCLFWAKSHTFEQIKELYYMIWYLENLNGMIVDYFPDERFENFNGEIILDENYVNANYEDFFAAINVYSKMLLSKEDRYLMKLYGLALRFYEDMGIINEHDLFYFSEKENIAKMLDSKYKNIWIDCANVDKIDFAKPNQEGLILYSKPKIRQASPLCMATPCEVCEIHEFTGNSYHELNDLREAIELVPKPLVGNLDKRTARILSKYNR
jgi:hypothetical protein